VSTGGTLTFAGSNGFTATISGATVTLSDPQNLQTTATPSFAGVTATGGWLTSGQSTEVVYAAGAASSTTITYDLTTGPSYYHSSVTAGANWTANFTNAPTTDARSIVATIIISQGSTAYIPNAVQIGGTAYTVKWIGGLTPAGTASGVDVFTFALIHTGGSFALVLGTFSGYQ
jgi:hypothetical protein